MRHLLLHPTHRKFIRLLRDRIKAGQAIVFAQSDLDSFHSLCEIESMNMIERHQRIYRIVLRAVYRPIDQIDKNEKVCIVGEDSINHMESCLFEAERKHLGVTLLSGYVYPTMLYMNKKSPKGVAIIMARIMRFFLGDKIEMRKVEKCK